MQFYRLLLLLASVSIQKCVTGIHSSDYLRPALLPSLSTHPTYTKTAAEILGSEQYREEHTFSNGTSAANSTEDDSSAANLTEDDSSAANSTASAANSTADDSSAVNSTDDDSSAANSTASAANSTDDEASADNSTSNESQPSSLPTVTSTIAVVDVNSTSSSTENEDEDEGVIRGKPTTTAPVNGTMTSKSESIYAKALALISDTYTLSIVVPVAAGVVFASSVLLTLALCRCLRWKCRQRRLRKKSLPGSVKNVSRSDSARLLAESSDEEF